MVRASLRQTPAARTTTVKLLVSALLSTMLVACSRNVETSPGKTGRVVTTLSEIAGPWDIASFNGYSPVRLHEGIRRAYVDVGATGLSYVIGCNYSGNRARIDDSGILHKVDQQPQTLIECGPEGDARDAAFFGFFASRPKVTWTEGGRLRLFAGRTELILERPEMRRLANIPRLAEMVGSWTPQEALHLLNGNGYGGRSFQGAYPLTITRNTITYPGCGGASFRFDYTRDARMRISEARAKDECWFNDPDTVLLRVLRSGPLVERDAGGGLALTAGDDVITLKADHQISAPSEGRPRLPAYIRTPRRPPANQHKS